MILSISQNRRSRIQMVYDDNPPQRESISTQINLRDTRDSAALDNMKLFWTIALGFKRKYGIDPEDLVQAATVRVLEKAHKFDPARGVKPATYFGTIARNAMRESLCMLGPVKTPRTFTAKCEELVRLARQPGRQLLDDQSVEGDEGAVDDADELAAMHRAERRFTPEQRWLLSTWYSGEPGAQHRAAAALGVTSQALRCRVVRLLRKLREALTDG